MFLMEIGMLLFAQIVDHPQILEYLNIENYYNEHLINIVHHK